MCSTQQNTTTSINAHSIAAYKIHLVYIPGLNQSQWKGFGGWKAFPHHFSGVMCCDNGCNYIRCIAL